MVFSSPFFLFAFFPVCAAIYFAAPRRAKNVVLLALSAVFYVWGGGAFFLLMLASAAVDYAVASAVYSRRSVDVAAPIRSLIAVSVVANVGLLVWFKYAGLGVRALNAVSELFGLHQFAVPVVVLPLAISFFTFQRMSFTFDVAAGRIERFPRFLDYLLFGLLFPHLIAGPIVRYVDIEDEIVNRPVRVDDIANGCVRFAHGLGKKVLIADTLAPAVDASFVGTAAPQSTAAAWVGALLYAAQLYFDFSGYSDMAIGLGKVFGFGFPENFNRPYSAVSVTDFWRRWHISLSSWFRDYVYIPLGGSRGSKASVIRNVAIVFAITGLWHGAALSFLAWGCFHGAFVIFERLTGLGATDPRARFWPVRRAATLIVVVFGWAIFRANGLGHGVLIVQRMLIPQGSGVPRLVIDAFDHRAALAAAVAAATVLLPANVAVGALLSRGNGRAIKGYRWVVVAAVLPAALVMVSIGNFTPFLYFQF